MMKEAASKKSQSRICSLICFILYLNTLLDIIKFAKVNDHVFLTSPGLNMERKRVSRPRLLLSILQALFALLALICLGSLSSTQCWNHEPSERGFLWWLTPSTVLVAIGNWFLEAHGANTLFKTAVDAISTVFWIGGIGAAGQLNTITTEVKNCHSKHGPFPETGAITAFAVFEMILFALGVYHARKGLPWPQSDKDDSNCEGGHPSDPTASMTNLQCGDFMEYITAHVGDGDEKKDFPVAKGPLCRRSKFIRSAVSDSWTTRLGMPSKAKEVDLSDDDPMAFEAYLGCVMGNTVAVKDLDVQHPTRLQSDDVFMRLFNLYVLADKLEDPETMNLVISRIARYCLAVHRVPNREAVTYVYDNSVRSSPLRLLIVDVYCLGYDRDGTKEDHLDGMPNEFLIQYMKDSPDAQTVVPGSQRYHQTTDRQQIYRGLFQQKSSS